MKKIVQLLFAASLLLMTGCASSKMMALPEGTDPLAADPGKATIVFMRPSAFGGAIQSYVFLYDDEKPEFVGIVSTNYKIAYQVAPGRHLFMVMGENGDFLDADVAANHLYHVIVEPHIGFMSARFSLDPVPKSDVGTKDFKDDLDECHFVTNTPESLQWFERKRDAVVAKYNSYYPDWAADPEDQQRLSKGDGLPME